MNTFIQYTNITGRPIVKGNGGMSMINQQHSQIQYAANLELQMQNQYANMQARNKLNFGQSKYIS